VSCLATVVGLSIVRLASSQLACGLLVGCFGRVAVLLGGCMARMAWI
jgi:hypothetical protein